VDKGFWWAHMGWLVMKQEENRIGKTDMTDLLNDKMLVFQHKYYGPLAVFIGLVMPTLIAGLGWGDYRGGFFLAGMLRTAVVLQCTFFINSLAHFWGDATYSDQRSSRDSYFVSLLTWGEGYHNFHHEFPYDYRNGVKSIHYDPGKWCIYFLSLFGLTYNLKRFSESAIAKGKLKMEEKKLAERKAKLDWGTPASQLPEFSWSDIKSRVSDGQYLMVIEDVVYELSRDFRDHHPGGTKYIDMYNGKDITAVFNGTVYNHSFGA
jgi:stearoyl-CoA desaturase (delta-9 desaturase)